MRPQQRKSIGRGRPAVLRASLTIASPASPPTQSAKQHWAEQLTQSPAGTRLISWVRNHGGLVHPNLAVVESTPDTYCRGVLALKPISVAELEEAPLIAVPEQLYMTSNAAQQLLQRAKVRKHNQLSPVLELALLLAHERSKGPASAWGPYIEALPLSPPCAWLLPDKQLEVELRKLQGTPGGCSPQQVLAARHAVQQQVNKAVSIYGDALGVTEADLTWAVAQVVSRAFGSDTELGLAPLIDMCNHKAGYDIPAGWQEDEDSGQALAAITSMREGDFLPLAAGDELYISYMSSCSPTTAFLNFGFVPPELLGPHPHANSRPQQKLTQPGILARLLSSVG